MRRKRSVGTLATLRPQRWAMLAADLLALAERVDAGELDHEQAAEHVRELLARECLALDPAREVGGERTGRTKRQPNRMKTNRIPNKNSC